MDGLTEKISMQRDAHEGDYESDDTLGEGQLILCKVLVLVVVFFLINGQDLIEQSVVRSQLEPYIAAKTGSVPQNPG